MMNHVKIGARNIGLRVSKSKVTVVASVLLERPHEDFRDVLCEKDIAVYVDAAYWFFIGSRNPLAEVKDTCLDRGGGMERRNIMLRGIGKSTRVIA
ncbi:MAG: hypothetical protein AB7D51_15650 [Desulfovibrionaceae bacterium]